MGWPEDAKCTRIWCLGKTAFMGKTLFGNDPFNAGSSISMLVCWRTTKQLQDSRLFWKISNRGKLSNSCVFAVGLSSKITPSHCITSLHSLPAPAACLWLHLHQRSFQASQLGLDAAFRAASLIWRILQGNHPADAAPYPPVVAPTWATKTTCTKSPGASQIPKKNCAPTKKKLDPLKRSPKENSPRALGH